MCCSTLNSQENNLRAVQKPSGTVSSEHNRWSVAEDRQLELTPKPHLSLQLWF